MALWTVDGFMGNNGIFWIWSAYVTDMFMLAVWKGKSAFIPAKTELVGCLAMVLWLVRGKLTVDRTVRKTKAIATPGHLLNK